MYILGTVAQHGRRQLPVRVTLDGGQETEEQRVALWRESGIGFYRPITYRREVKENVTIIVNRNTAPSTEEMRADLDQFVTEAALIAEEAVAILDLRDHGGGQWDPALRWAEALAGQPITYEQHNLKLRTRTALTLKRNFVEWYLRDNDERRILSTTSIRSQLDRLRPFDPADDPIWITQHFTDTQPALLPNSTQLYVLMDGETGSAGEDLVYFLRQLDNVIFVGENTKGQNISGEPAWGTLPNSGLSFAITLDATLTSGWMEGVGYSPDIWVNPDRALGRVLRFLE